MSEKCAEKKSKLLLAAKIGQKPTKTSKKPKAENNAKSHKKKKCKKSNFEIKISIPKSL